MTTSTFSPAIVPHLWFDKEAREAASFYASVFPESGAGGIASLDGTPSGSVDIVSFRLWGLPFMAISAGPLFQLNPSISFYVYCGSPQQTESLYHQLVAGGMAMMPLDKYPWSDQYAWVKDRYGVTWQLDCADMPGKQRIVPAFLFANALSHAVKDAVNWYTGIFPNSEILLESPYDPSANQPEGTLLFAQFLLNGYQCNAMSSIYPHDFAFNEAASLIVYCDTQEEIDHYWNRLCEGGQEQPCGWLKDRFGVSWQIVPRAMGEMMGTQDPEQRTRVTQTMLTMKKFDLAAMWRAYHGG